MWVSQVASAQCGTHPHTHGGVLTLAFMFVSSPHPPSLVCTGPFAAALYVYNNFGVPSNNSEVRGGQGSGLAGWRGADPPVLC